MIGTGHVDWSLKMDGFMVTTTVWMVHWYLFFTRTRISIWAHFKVRYTPETHAQIATKIDSSFLNLHYLFSLAHINLHNFNLTPHPEALSQRRSPIRLAPAWVARKSPHVATCECRCHSRWPSNTNSSWRVGRGDQILMCTDRGPGFYGSCACVDYQKIYALSFVLMVFLVLFGNVIVRTRCENHEISCHFQRRSSWCLVVNWQHVSLSYCGCTKSGTSWEIAMLLWNNVKNGIVMGFCPFGAGFNHHRLSTLVNLIFSINYSYESNYS